jgi:hypothetical protein
MGRRRIDRLWSKVHDQERRHEGGWGKSVQQLDEEWRGYLQTLVDDGSAENLTEADRLAREGFEEERPHGRPRS